MAVIANFLVQESLLLRLSFRSGDHVPANLRQDKRYSLFCTLLSLYQCSPAFLPAGNSFLEDHFFTDQGDVSDGEQV